MLDQIDGENMKLAFALFLSLLSGMTYAGSCRDQIVSAYELIGVQIKADSFSSTSFEELGLSFEEFNELPSEKQEEIYSQIRPLEVMVEQVIFDLNAKIDEVAGTFYEFFMGAELEAWRLKRAELRKCNGTAKKLIYNLL